MILQALEAYYRRKQADPDPRNRLPAYGLEEKEIPFIVEIDNEGRLVVLADTRSDGKKRIAQSFLVPRGLKKTSGVAANLLWDTAEYVLGVDTRGNAERVARQHAAFRERIQGLPAQALSDRGIQAVMLFLDDLEHERLAGLPAWPEILSSNPLMTFRLQAEEELICQRRAVVDAAVREGEPSASAICLVTGEEAPIERLHPAIKGVWGAQTSGANIVSFNLDAFRSYHKEQGDNAPIGKPAAFAYTCALNHLLAKGSRQRVQVGDAATVFWAERPHDLETLIPDAFGEPPRDDPDRGTAALKALHSAVESGKFSLGDPGTRFHVLGLAPNAARLSIRYWDTAPAIALATRIRRHFEGLRIARGPRDPEHLSLFRLLTSCAAQGKADHIPPNLAGEVMRAILAGSPYPVTLLNAAVRRCRAEQRVSYPRASVIKAWLNRAGECRPQIQVREKKELLPMLDIANPSPAYRLGRLFATLEKIQEEASPGLNATIRDRYYAAASGTPVAVFPTLLRLKNHHLGHLHAGRVVQMERLLGEILGGLSDFPGSLPLPEQGRFALGYYHQRQAFFTKSDATTDKETSP